MAEVYYVDVSRTAVNGKEEAEAPLCLRWREDAKGKEADEA